MRGAFRLPNPLPKLIQAACQPCFAGGVFFLVECALFFIAPPAADNDVGDNVKAPARNWYTVIAARSIITKVASVSVHVDSAVGAGFPEKTAQAPITVARRNITRFDADNRRLADFPRHLHLS